MPLLAWWTRTTWTGTWGGGQGLDNPVTTAATQQLNWATPAGCRLCQRQREAGQAQRHQYQEQPVLISYQQQQGEQRPREGQVKGAPRQGDPWDPLRRLGQQGQLQWMA